MDGSRAILRKRLILFLAGVTTVIIAVINQFHVELFSDTVSRRESAVLPANLYRHGNAESSALNKSDEGFTRYFLRQRKKENFQYLYYQHVRKCGGTVGKTLIANTSAAGNYFENEFFSFPTNCLDQPQANQTLFFTMLRDPVERYMSEFRYRGLPSLYNLTHDSTDEQVRAAIRHWVNVDGETCMKKKWAPSCFYSNIYVRLFSGKDRCRIFDVPPNTSHNEIFWRWAGSTIGVDAVTQEDFEVAMETLRRFDLVLTTDKLGLSATEQAIRVGFNVSRDSTWNATAHVTRNEVIHPLAYEGVREIVQEHLQYDIKLFQFFDNIQQRLDVV